MKKTVKIFSIFLIISIVLYLSSTKKDISCNDLHKSNKNENIYPLPKDLIHKGIPISDKYMKYLLPQINSGLCIIDLNQECILNNKFEKIDSEEDRQYSEYDFYNWEYISTLPNGDHLVWAEWTPDYFNPEQQRFYGGLDQIAIIRRTNNTLRVISALGHGADPINTSPIEWNPHTNTLKYKESVTPSTFFHDLLLKTFPEYKQLLENKEGCYDLSMNYLGYKIQRVSISNDGMFINNDILISFHYIPYHKNQEKKYINWKLNKSHTKNSLTMEDAINEILAIYTYKHKIKKLTVPHLKKIAYKICKYAKDKENTY
jgi:hypothetical protein